METLHIQPTDNALQTQTTEFPREILTNYLLSNNVSGLTPEQQGAFLLRLYSIVGVAPETGSIILMDFQKSGKLSPYFTANFADNMRARHQICVQETGSELIGDDAVGYVYVVKVRVHSPDGRYTDEAAALPWPKMDLAERARVYMKVRTKAARRATMKHLGLGIGLEPDDLPGISERYGGEMSAEQVEAMMAEDKAPAVKRLPNPATDKSKSEFVALLGHPALAAHKEAYLGKLPSYSEKELKEKIGLAETAIANYEKKQADAAETTV